MVDTNFQINDNSEANQKHNLYNSKINAIYSQVISWSEHKCIFQRKKRKEKRKDLLDGLYKEKYSNAQHTVNKFHLFFGKWYWLMHTQTVSLALLGAWPTGCSVLKPVLSERERSLLVECNVLFVPYGENTM